MGIKMKNKDLKFDSILKKIVSETKEAYPELRSVVNKIVPQIINLINSNTKSVTSKMPYKNQWVLEEIIKELEKRV
jgi:hypothetical protein